MKRWAFPIIAIVGVGASAYQGHLNASPNHELDDVALDIACDAVGACDPKHRQGHESTPFQRTYLYQASGGQELVTCRWPYLLWGTPACEGSRVRQGPEGEHVDYPHKLRRGQLHYGD